MSKTQQDALAPLIDQRVRQYVDATIQSERREAKAREDRLTHRLEQVQTDLNLAKATLHTLQQRLDDISSTTPDAKPHSDDKYALTKAKLIRLMKDLGYYD